MSPTAPATTSSWTFCTAARSSRSSSPGVRCRCAAWRPSCCNAAVPCRRRSINGDLPEELQAIILETLEKDPARRYQSMSELHDALLNCMEALGVSTELPRIGEAADGPVSQGTAPGYRSGVVATPARGATV